ncbi:MAG TPA: iron export ABC transporter permease subunit FetB [Aquificaceae bacterium]|nr:iron export ABC transporter permease subunit FetB [Aquificaceae bacterium]
MENLVYLNAYLLVLFAFIISYVEGLRIEKDIFWSSLRTLLQLLILAYILKYVFEFPEIEKQFLVFAFMTLVASLIFTERSKSIKLFPVVYLSITLSYALPILFLILTKVLKTAPHELIPFGGLIIGNTLNSLSLFYDRIKAEIRNRKEEIEAKISLGATLRYALIDVIRDSIKMALIPKLNWLKSAGLVHIPGVAVGMLVAGVSPLKAILFQVVILYTLLFSGIVGTSLLAFIGIKEIFRKSFEKGESDGARI